jgi:hypothetical protein
MKILINEKQLKNIIKEAIPYNLAKPYIKTKRTEGALALINKVFDKLKNLPNAKVLDRRGDRISLPYSEDSLEQRIKEFLLQYEYTIKNYQNNKAENIRRPGQETKITSALSFITKSAFKLDKKDDANQANEFLDLYAAARSKDATNMGSKIIVFSKHPYDIAGMTFGRSWPSCMHLITGLRKEFVKVDIAKGTVIAYLTTPNDTNLENVLGRVLIKPYVNIKDDNDFILYPEHKTYGKVEDPKVLINYLDDILESVQDIGSEYNLLSCLNVDSERTFIISKKNVRKRALSKLKIGASMNENEIGTLNSDEKHEYIDKRLYRIKNSGIVDGLLAYEYMLASKEQIANYIQINIWNKLQSKRHLTDNEITHLSEDDKRQYINNRIDEYENAEDLNSFDNPVILTIKELSLASKTQLARYFKSRIANFYFTVKTEYKTMRRTVPTHGEVAYMPVSQFNSYIDFEIFSITSKNKWATPTSEYFDYASPSQIEDVLNAKINSGAQLTKKELSYLTEEQKNIYYK